MRTSLSSVRLSSLLWGVGWALVALLLALNWTQVAALPLDAENASPPHLAATATIKGTLLYTGVLTGTYHTYVGAYTTLSGPPAYGMHRFGLGPYTLTVESGVYYLQGVMETDGKPGRPDPLKEPIGFYEHNPVTVAPGEVLTGIDIVLRDYSPEPNGIIRGEVSYSGKIPGTYPIVILVVRQGQPEPFILEHTISGTGPFEFTQVPDSPYTIGAYMDVNSDKMWQAGEPWGWHDPTGDGQADIVVIHGGNTIEQIHVILHDDPYRVNLPLVTRLRVP